MAEALGHPHNRARGTFVDVDGVVQPGPAPRFSRTPGRIQHGPAKAGSTSAEALRAWGVSADEIAEVMKLGALADH
jgi:alpha-methylacyl-CoA racemase